MTVPCLRLPRLRRRQWELCILALLSLVLFIRFAVKFALEPPFLMDLEVYRITAQRLLGGQIDALYQPTHSELMMFKYAPCWIALVAPLAWLSAHQAAVAWSVLTAGWIAFACWGSHRLTEHAGVPAPAWAAVAVAGLLVRPILAEFLNGQTDVLWAALVIAFLLAEARQQQWRAALWLALAVSLKLPAAIFLIGRALRGRIATVARTLAALALLNVAAALLIARGRWLEVLSAWAEALGSSGPSRAFEIGNQSLLALAGRLLMADGYGLNLAAWPAPAVTLVAAAALLGLTLVIWRSAAAADRAAPARGSVAGGVAPATESATSRLVWDGALLTILMVLGSPTVWIATYAALIFPVMLGVAAIVRAVGQRRDDAVSMLLAALTVGLSLLTKNGLWKRMGWTQWRGEPYIYLVFMILPLFALSLFALLIRQRRRGISGS